MNQKELYKPANRDNMLSIMATTSPLTLEQEIEIIKEVVEERGQEKNNAHNIVISDCCLK